MRVRAKGDLISSSWELFLVIPVTLVSALLLFLGKMSWPWEANLMLFLDLEKEFSLVCAKMLSRELRSVPFLLSYLIFIIYFYFSSHIILKVPGPHSLCSSKFGFFSSSSFSLCARASFISFETRPIIACLSSSVPSWLERPLVFVLCSVFSIGTLASSSAMSLCDILSPDKLKPYDLVLSSPLSSIKFSMTLYVDLLKHSLATLHCESETILFWF